jgi:hypothetical protein
MKREAKYSMPLYAGQVSGIPCSAAHYIISALQRWEGSDIEIAAA